MGALDYDIADLQSHLEFVWYLSVSEHIFLARSDSDTMALVLQTKTGALRKYCTGIYHSLRARPSNEIVRKENFVGSHYDKLLVLEMKHGKSE